MFTLFFLELLISIVVGPANELLFAVYIGTDPQMTEFCLFG